MSTPDTRIVRGYRIDATPASPVSRIARLSDRQREIVRRQCENGQTMREIGLALGIHWQTVKNHWSAIRAAVGVASTCEVCTAWGRHAERREITEVVRAVATLPGMRARDV